MKLRLLSDLVAKHIMGECVHKWKQVGPNVWNWGCTECHKQAGNALHPNPSFFPAVGDGVDYASDMAAAFRVWQMLRAQGVYLDVHTYADFYAVTARRNDGTELAYEEAATLPEAICAVALLVKGVEVPSA